MSIFKNIIKSFFPFSDENEEVSDVIIEHKNEHIDEKFVRNFSDGGGYFNYCRDEKEALITLNKIIKTEKIKKVLCFDEDLKKFLDIIEIPSVRKITPDIDASFITCEYLAANNGNFVLTENNISYYQSGALPKIRIIMAHVSQIIPTLEDAMQRFKRNGKVRKNITSIGGADHLVSKNDDKNKYFLLLLED